MNLIGNFLKADFSSYESFKNTFKLEYSDNFNFAYDVVDEYARLCPEKRALVWVNDADEEHIFSFGDIKRLSDKAANYLKELGVRKGDFVLVMLKQHYMFWILIPALLKLGATVIPSTHLLKKKDIIYRCNAAPIKGIIAVTDDIPVDAVNAAEAECPSLKFKCVIGESREGWLDLKAGVENASEDFIRPTGDEATTVKDNMLGYFTSGTTGMPKLVMHDYAYPLGHIVTAAFWQNVVEDGLHLTVADTGWAKAAWGKIFGQWIAGTGIFAFDYDRFHADSLMQKVCDYGVTTFCGPATVYRFMIKEDLSQYDFSKLKHATVAGEPLNPEVQAQFERATGGIRLMEGYGQTESAIIAGTFKWIPPRPGSMGKANPAYDIVLLDDDENVCSEGEEGQLCIRVDQGKPAGLFSGYYGDEERFLQVVKNGYYRTGDIVWKDEDGYIWFVGRTDDVIKSSGYRIGPFEVESLLMEHPSVLECAVTGVPDAVRGQAVKATIVLAKGYEPSDALSDELKAYVKKNTAPYKYPRVIEFVSELPKTISGKIMRKEIVRRDLEKYKN